MACSKTTAKIPQNKLFLLGHLHGAGQILENIQLTKAGPVCKICSPRLHFLPWPWHPACAWPSHIPPQCFEWVPQQNMWRGHLTARIFFWSCSATQGHHPLTVFCSKSDTRRLEDKVSSTSSKEHFSAVLAGLGILLRSIWMEPARRNVTGKASRCNRPLKRGLFPGRNIHCGTLLTSGSLGRHPHSEGESRLKCSPISKHSASFSQWLFLGIELLVSPLCLGRPEPWSPSRRGWKISADLHSYNVGWSALIKSTRQAEIFIED